MGSLIKTVLRLERTVCKRNPATGLCSHTNEVVFWVSSASDQTPERWNESIRAHWRIENGSHYVRDTAFAEDASRIRKNPDIVARLRSFAYNLIRVSGCDNIRNARWRAALDINLVLEMPSLALELNSPGTQAQWVANARNGFNAQSSAGGNNTKCISMTGSHITNVRVGAGLSANLSVFSGNEIDHFADDGVDFAASGLNITKNYIHDNVSIGDGVHPDAMQGQIGVAVPGVASNNYSQILIDSNTIIRQTDPKLPFPKIGLQGIDAFDSDWTYLTVTNNIVVTTRLSGGLVLKRPRRFDRQQYGGE